MKNLKIGSCLGLGFVEMVMLMVLTMGIGIWRLNTVDEVELGVTGTRPEQERFISDWYRIIHSAERRTSAVTKSADSSLVTFFASFAEK